MRNPLVSDAQTPSSQLGFLCVCHKEASMYTSLFCSADDILSKMVIQNDDPKFVVLVGDTEPIGMKQAECSNVYGMLTADLSSMKHSNNNQLNSIKINA